MNSSFSKFLLFSLMVISSLGALKCERLESAESRFLDSGQTPVKIEQVLQKQMEARSQQGDPVSKDDEGKFAFKFPNIFDVFRSLF